MSYETTKLGFGLLNSQLNKLYQAGEPLCLTVHGRPRIQVLSFEPVAYETYGTFRNRAPYVAGKLALRSFLTQRDDYSNGVFVCAAVEAGEHVYGFAMDGDNPQEREVISDIARVLGYSQLQFKQNK